MVLLVDTPPSGPRRTRPRPGGPTPPAPSCCAVRAAALAGSSAGFPAAAERTVRDWQAGVLELVRREGGGRRTTARAAAYGVNATGLLVMIVIFATTNVIAAPLEVAVAGGIPVLSQKVLEAMFGDQAVRRLAETARADLLERVAKLLDDERERYDTLLAAHAPDPEAAAAAGARGGRGGAGAMRLEETHPLMYRRQRRAEQQAERDRAAVGVDVTERLAALDAVITAGDRAAARRAAGPRPGAGPPGRRAAADVRLAHRGGAGRGHRQRQVLAVQRAGRVADVRGRGAPADHRRRARGDLGRRRAPGPLLDWLQIPRRHYLDFLDSRTRATTGWTGWCCWTCPTTTRPPSRTGWRWTGWSTWSTCWCGCWTRRSTPTPPCTSATCARWPGTPA